MKSWKLNDSNFTLIDRLKISAFFLNSKNFWTMTDKVARFEEKISDFTNSKYSIFVSSGSTANTILAYYLKDNFYTDKRNTIVFPSTTWITSVSPFIREGFKPKFIDITLDDLAIDLNKLESFLDKNHEEVSCIFVTSLLGIVPNIDKLIEIKNKYNINIMMDNCENTFGKFNNKNISSYFTSTTSTYFGHQLQSVEGGFIFTNHEKERDLFLMYRNHGMTRSIKNNSQIKNNDVDSRFDFYLQGNNFRNSNIHALIGLLDLNRVDKYINDRQTLYNYFCNKVNDSILKYKNNDKNENSLFCIPLIFNDKIKKEKTEQFCYQNNIESRPIISGNLLRQTCLKKYDDYYNFPNSEYIHQNGFYVGLNSKVSFKQLDILINFINNL
jgi:CDP-6-deoxy-D-xylo-4-hexulose-3-dehydrase